MAERILEFILTGDSKNLEKSLTKTEQKLKVLEEKSKKTAKHSALIFAGFATAGTDAVLQFAKFEKQMAKVGAITNATEKDFQKLKATALKLGETTEFTASEAAQGLEYLALAGYNTKQAIDALPATLALATVGQIDLAQASDMLTDVMSQFSLSAQDAQGSVDIFTKISQTSNTSVGQLGSALLNTGLSAKQFGLSIGETSAILAVFANQGKKGDEAGTSLNRMLTDLQNNSGKLKEFGINIHNAEGGLNSFVDVLGQYEEKVNTSTDAERQRLFQLSGGIQTQKALSLALNGGVDAYKRYIKETENATGVSEIFRNKLLDTVDGSIKLMTSALQGLVISLGEKLAPTFRVIVDGITSLATSFNNLSETTKETIAKVGLVVTGLFAFRAIFAIINVLFLKGIGSVIAYSTSLLKLSRGTATATTATTIFGAALRSLPILNIISLVSSLVFVFSSFGKELNETTKTVSAINEELEKQIKAKKNLSDADKQAVKTKLIAEAIRMEYKEQNDALNSIATTQFALGRLTKEQGEENLKLIEETNKALEEKKKITEEELQTTQKQIESLEKQAEAESSVFVSGRDGINQKLVQSKNLQRINELTTQQILLEDNLVENSIVVAQFAQKRLDIEKAIKENKDGQNDKSPIAENNNSQKLEQKLAQTRENNQKILEEERESLKNLKSIRDDEAEIDRARAENSSSKEIEAIKKTQATKRELLTLSKNYKKSLDDAEGQYLKEKTAIEEDRLNSKSEAERSRAVKALEDLTADSEARQELITEQYEIEKEGLEIQLQEELEIKASYKEQELSLTSEHLQMLENMSNDEKANYIANNLDKYNHATKTLALEKAAAIKYENLKEGERKKENKRKIAERAQFLKDEEQYGTAIATLKKSLNSQELKDKENTLNSLSELQSSKSKELFEVGKAAAIAQSAIDTARGAVAAYTSLAGIPFVGQALGIAAAAALVAYGTEKVNIIKNQNMRKALRGGVVSGGVAGVDTEPFLLSKGEAIIPADITPELNNTFRQLREQKTDGFNQSESGNISVDINFNGDLQSLAEILEPKITITQERNGVAGI